MKYLILATFASYTDDDQELFTNQWKVKVIDSLEDCYKESELDLLQVGKDSLEGRFDDEDKLDKEIKNYLSSKEICHRSDTDFKDYEPLTILSNDYWVEDHREIINYIVIKID